MDRTKLEEFVASIERDVYARAEQATLRSIIDYLSERLAGTAKPTPAKASAVGSDQPRRRAMKVGSDQFRVLEAIQLHPNGIRGADIVDATERSGKAVQERTMRTALSRLRSRGLIAQGANGLWYPATNPLTGQPVELPAVASSSASRVLLLDAE